MAARGMKGLQVWCKQNTSGYEGVNVTNMTTSWRDGLAFCALIHKFYPELIDFDALSKENILHNNQLAFSVAEKELSIPALLDAEDMVAMKVPDKLSIMTYVSQYYNTLHNLKPSALKRSAETFEPKDAPEEVTVHKKKMAHDDKKPDNIPSEKASSFSTCDICKKRVHLVERYIDEGKIYHRQCHRTKSLGGMYRRNGAPDLNQYSNQFLNLKEKKKNDKPDSPKPKPDVDKCENGSEKLKPKSTENINSEIPTFKSAVDRWENNIEKSKSANNKITSGNHKPAKIEAKTTTDNKSKAISPPIKVNEPSEPEKQEPKISKSHIPKLSSNESLSASSESDQDMSKLLPSLLQSLSQAKLKKKKQTKVERNDNRDDISSMPPLVGELTKCKQPASPLFTTDNSNPFKTSSTTKSLPNKTENKSSFETKELNVKQSDENHIADKKLNPFEVSSESSDEEIEKSPKVEVATVSEVINKYNAETKKSFADRKNPFDVSLSSEEENKIENDETQNVVAPKAEEKIINDKMKLEPTEKSNMDGFPSSNVSKSPDKSPAHTGFKPSRKAPGFGFPLVKRKVKSEMTEEEIANEINILSIQLGDLEKKGIKLEEVLRVEMDHDGKEWKIEHDDLLSDWFELVHDKNKLVRRESDLIFLMQQQRLEQQHADIEFKIRKLLNKPDAEKSPEEREEEENLLEELVKIVERRNVIINSIEEERVKEEEEDEAYNLMKKLQKDVPTDSKQVKKKKKNKIKKMFSKRKHNIKPDPPK